MRHRILLATLLALAPLSAGCISTNETPAGKESNWDALVLFSERASNDDFVDDYPAIGFQVATIQPGSGGWGLEAGANYGWGDGSGPGSAGTETRDTDFYEFGVGIHQTFRPDSALRPYFGLGGSWMRSYSTQRSATDKDTFTTYGAGVYAHTGVLWSPHRDATGRGTGIEFGLDLRGMLADDADYLELSLITGFGR